MVDNIKRFRKVPIADVRSIAKLSIILDKVVINDIGLKS